MTLTVPQLCLLRSLKQSWEASLLPIFLRRSGATEADWDALLTAGYVTVRGGRCWRTEAGRIAYTRRPRNVYF